jgi:formamidopyrimidine-DNA glycosylase
MPELPEVETVVQDLRPHLEGRTITNVRVLWARTIAEPLEAPERFRAAIRGSRIMRLGRRGKFILLYLGDGRSSQPLLTCLIHLRMSGRLLLEPSGPPRHLRLVYELSDGGRLYFYDQRKFGRIWLVQDPEVVLGDLGPEPLRDSFDREMFSALLSRRRGRIKPLLLNQQFIAGLGNIYVDEALFCAGLHPERTADTLTTVEMDRLHDAIQTVLRRAIQLHGTTFDGMFVRPEGEEGRHQEGLKVYGQAGLPCVRCGTAIERTKVAGRGTHFCPHCQPPNGDGGSSHHSES